MHLCATRTMLEMMGKIRAANHMNAGYVGVFVQHIWCMGDDHRASNNAANMGENAVKTAKNEKNGQKLTKRATTTPLCATRTMWGMMRSKAIAIPYRACTPGFHFKHTRCAGHDCGRRKKKEKVGENGRKNAKDLVEICMRKTPQLGAMLRQNRHTWINESHFAGKEKVVASICAALGAWRMCGE